jgi:DNA anti-recombination protein RmuC
MDTDAKQLRLFTDAILENQRETQRLVRQVAQNIEIATQQAQEDNDDLIQALDDLREQIRDLTEVIAEANGIWR